MCTELGRKLNEISQKEQEDLKKLQETAQKEQQKFKDELYKMLKEDVEREQKMSEVWQKQGNLFKTAEVTSEITSIVADSAIDIYGHVNPVFTKRYKVIRGALGGLAEKGLSGLVEGTIKGTADSILVGSKLNIQNKAYVRFGGRVIASQVGSIIRDENSEQSFNSLTNGVIDGVLHAGTGVVMDKLTGNLPKLKIRYVDAVKNWTTENHVTASNAISDLLGPGHGGLQRLSTRAVRDFAVKPYGTNKIKQNKNDIF